jgi:hypothetical protein
MTQEEFREKLARLVYKFVNNNEDEDFEECVDLEYEFDFMNNKIDLNGTIVFSYSSTKTIKEEGYL